AVEQKQGVPPGMAQVSEEEDLQAAEEVSEQRGNVTEPLRNSPFIFPPRNGALCGGSAREIWTCSATPAATGITQQTNHSKNKRTGRAAIQTAGSQSSLVGCQNQTIRGETGGPTYTEKLKRQLSSLEDMESQTDSGYVNGAPGII
ncbi:hypothetical protein cypCar_00014418, partial [Cyprinus carpio]